MPLRTRTLLPGVQIVAFLMEPPEHSNCGSREVQITHLEWGCSIISIIRNPYMSIGQN